MPTSATGSRSERGFSLAELMVVLAIVGLSAAVVLIAWPSDRGAVRSEAEQLGAKLLAARDNALFTQNETAAIIEPSGYRFETRRGADWTPASVRALRPNLWDNDVAPLLTGGERQRLRFDATGLTDAAEIVLTNGDARASVIVDGAGGVRVED
ncbi:MAG: prepilin-type N-terminal cleavage/methylation domain-containing protein [Pacificimonas sp.]